MLLEQRLRLTFSALTEGEMLSIRSHYLGQQGRFLSFDIPNDLLSGTANPTSFTPTEYGWIYADRPQITDIGLQRYDVTLELATVPPEGATINGVEFTVTSALEPGIATVATVTTGFDLTVTASLEGGVVADNTSAGFDISVPVSLLSGAANPGVSSGFALASITLGLSGTALTTTVNVFAVNTVNSSVTVQVVVTPVDFL